MQLSGAAKKMPMHPSKMSGYFPAKIGKTNLSSLKAVDGYLLAHDSTKNSLTGKKGPAFLKHYHELKATNSTQYAFYASDQTKRNFKETQQKLGIIL